MVDNSDETNFPHKLLTANRQVPSLRKELLTNHQLILCYQKLNYIRRYN